jgi:hypothetical protein
MGAADMGIVHAVNSVQDRGGMQCDMLVDKRELAFRLKWLITVENNAKGYSTLGKMGILELKADLVIMGI